MKSSHFGVFSRGPGGHRQGEGEPDGSAWLVLTDGGVVNIF